MVGRPIVLADRLRWARRRRHWSVQDLADRCRVRPPQIVALEAGVETDPTLATVLELATTLQIDPAWLAWGAGKDPVSSDGA